MSTALVGLGAGAAGIAVQVAALRRRVPRLPDAMGAREGLVPAEGPLLRVEVVGDSSVCGVGIERLDDSLVPWLTQRLAERCRRTVHWRCHGWSGARIAWLRERLLPRVDPRLDLLVVVVGVNDVIRLTSLNRWEQGVTAVLDDVDRRLGHVPIAWVGLPQLGHAAIVPQPLRTMLGARAAAFERRSQRVLTGRPAAWLVPTPSGDPALVGADGFHPNEEGYRRWATHLADRICPRLTSAQPPLSRLPAAAPSGPR